MLFSLMLEVCGLYQITNKIKIRILDKRKTKQFTKTAVFGGAVVVHAFHPNTRDAEAAGTLVTSLVYKS